mmetsp:Transcript_17614/g.42388  ORF Transcript_17614/g.42388 Transcript_17614/m.42388 type:complete len:303 (+) Transcript_17614:435-1343(+)
MVGRVAVRRRRERVRMRMMPVIVIVVRIGGCLLGVVRMMLPWMTRRRRRMTGGVVPVVTVVGMRRHGVSRRRVIAVVVIRVLGMVGRRGRGVRGGRRQRRRSARRRRRRRRMAPLPRRRRDGVRLPHRWTLGLPRELHVRPRRDLPPLAVLAQDALGTRIVIADDALPPYSSHIAVRLVPLLLLLLLRGGRGGCDDILVYGLRERERAPQDAVPAEALDATRGHAAAHRPSRQWLPGRLPRRGAELEALGAVMALRGAGGVGPASAARSVGGGHGHDAAVEGHVGYAGDSGGGGGLLWLFRV